MEHLLAITVLNDFVFCPYSIYLHQIYGDSQEDVYHNIYQSRGKRLHQFLEKNPNGRSLINSWVSSETLGIYGRIDAYDEAEEELIEYKSTVAVAYKGYYYQIWAQLICLREQGISVKKLSFFDFKTNTKIPIPLPTPADLLDLKNHIERVRHFDFESNFKVNPNKCRQCIYNNLCEKAIVD